MTSGFDKRIFKTNEYLLKEGTPSEAAFLISSGKVAVRKGEQGQNPQTLAILGKGAVVGEMSLFDDLPPMPAPSPWKKPRPAPFRAKNSNAGSAAWTR